MINIDDFKKVEIKIGKILSAERIEGSLKLLKLTVDLGEDEPRQILSGIASRFPDPSALAGLMAPFITNLEPRQMMGLTSHGMLMASDSPDGPVLLHPATEIPPGSVVK
jgi:methionine--tRNA ligase beta chain